MRWKTWTMLCICTALAIIAIQSCGKSDGAGVGGKVIINGANQ